MIVLAILSKLLTYTPYNQIDKVKGFDIETVNGLIEGKLSAMELIYNSLFNQIYAYSCSYVVDKEQAKEIAQDCFLSLWEMRKRLKPDTNLKALLLRIAHNKSLNYLKKQQTSRNYEDYLKYRELSINYHALKDKSAELVILQELEMLIRKTLEELPEPYRKVFEMSRNEHLTYSEIAERLGVSVKTVEYRMMHVLRIFRKNLHPYLPLIIAFLIRDTSP